MVGARKDRFEILGNAMNSSIRRLGVINTNLQNMNTVAYKQINPDSVMFGDMLKEMFRDDERGPLINTGRKLDLAIDKPNAYFLVEGENGPERIRDGSFHIDAQGKIVNPEGKELVILDTDGAALNLHQTEDIQVNTEGKIFANGNLVGRVAIDYDNKMPGEIAYVLQGQLEGSNVNLLENTMHISQTKRHLDTMQNILAMDLQGEKGLIEGYGRNV